MRKPDRGASTAVRHGRCEGANHGSPFRARPAAFSISASSPTPNDTKIPALRKAAQQQDVMAPHRLRHDALWLAGAALRLRASGGGREVGPGYIDGSR